MRTAKAELLNATVVGDGPATVVLGNGLGTTQATWRHIVAELAPHARVVRYDTAGAPNAAAESFLAARYGTLYGHVDDLLALLDELDVRNAIFVGHSVSGMIGLLAAPQAPDRIGRLVTIGASPRYIDDPGVDYVGGMTPSGVEQLLTRVATDYQAWVAGFSPLVIGDASRTDLVGEFGSYLLAMRPDIASLTLHTVYSSDHREALPRVRQPVTVIQAREDVAVPLCVGEYLAQQLPVAALHVLPLVGHVPHLTAPEMIVPILRDCLRQRTSARGH